MVNLYSVSWIFARTVAYHTHAFSENDPLVVQITCLVLPDSARDFLFVEQYCKVPIFDKFPDMSFKSMLYFDWVRAPASIWNLAWVKSHLLIGFPQSWMAITMVAKKPQIIKHIVRALKQNDRRYESYCTTYRLRFSWVTPKHMKV